MNKFPMTYEAACAFIAKADDDLTDKLKGEGYILAEETVERINNLNDELAEALEDEMKFLMADLEDLTDEELDDFLKKTYPTLMANDKTDEIIQEIMEAYLTEFGEELVDAYIKAFDKDLAFDYFCDRTTAWISSWSEDLGQLMKLSNHERMQTILSNAMENGESVATVVSKLQDAYAFSPQRARATAITEMLTAHSYAKQDAMVQSPVIDRKEWKHTGSHNNTPRKHHEAMNGQIVGKSEKFVISAPTGTYKCDFPRDTTLPPSERVNCHCLHAAVSDDSVFGLTVEERKALQQKAREADNGAWEKELDAKNKAKAGI